MHISSSTYGFISNKICPYCQSKIKNTSDFIICSQCGTPHHRECWDENGGCTTYGCINNPATVKKLDLAGEDVGGRTIDEIRSDLSGRKDKTRYINCPACKSEIEENSIYCKYCGYNLKEAGTGKIDKAKQEFEKEYKKKYREKVGSVRKRFYLTLASIILLLLSISIISYFAVKKINEILDSPEYQVKDAVDRWKEAWEDKNIEEFSRLLAEDYIYEGKDRRNVRKQDRLRSLEGTFRNYKFIEVDISGLKITEDTDSTGHMNASFLQEYRSDKFSDTGNKILKLRKTPGTGSAPGESEWKIYREYFE